jgi:hypothetical protein
MGCFALQHDLREAFAQGDGGGRCARGDAKLAEDAVEVVGHRALTQHQIGGNLTVGATSGDQTQYLNLPVGQAARASGWSCLIG